MSTDKADRDFRSLLDGLQQEFQPWQSEIGRASLWERLPFERFGIFLNPGHLTHLDEWLSSPIYRDSDVLMHSGMAIQVDIIPSSPIYFSTRMEDGIVLAAEELRQDLRHDSPDCYERCQKRKRFMVEVLGIELPDEILPLSNIPAIVLPFLLKPNTLLALEH